jgi:hypothetical protein
MTAAASSTTTTTTATITIIFSPTTVVNSMHKINKQYTVQS